MRTEIDYDRFQDSGQPRDGAAWQISWPGSALLWFPFFAVSWSLGTLLNAVGLAVDMNPFGRWFQFGVMVAGPAYAALALVLLGRLISRPRLVSVDPRALRSCSSCSPARSRLRRLRTVDEPCNDLLAYVLYLLAVLRWIERGPEGPRRGVAGGGALHPRPCPERDDGGPLLDSSFSSFPRGPIRKRPGSAFLRLRRFAGRALPLLLGVLPILALTATSTAAPSS